MKKYIVADNKDMIAETTGEVRPPKKGEWFIFIQGIPKAYKAIRNLSTPRKIAKLIARDT